MVLRASDPLQKMVEYLRRNIAKGYAQETLQIALFKQGYSRTEITKAVEIVQKEQIEEAKKSKPQIKYELFDEQDKIVYQQEKKSFWRKLMFWRK